MCTYMKKTGKSDQSDDISLEGRSMSHFKLVSVFYKYVQYCLLFYSQKISRCFNAIILQIMKRKN